MHGFLKWKFHVYGTYSTRIQYWDDDSDDNDHEDDDDDDDDDDVDDIWRR